MIVFIADGNPMIGSGHIMRCLSIADYMKKQGEEVLFSITSEDYAEKIAMHGHKIFLSKGDYREMNVYDIQEVLEKENTSAIFVDSYFVSISFMQELYVESKRIGAKLIYIDDICSKPVPADFILNYNVYANEAEYISLYNNRDMPELLLGLHYMPLREEFMYAPCVEIKKGVKNVLISTGGADLFHICLKTLQALAEGKNNMWRNCNFHILLGSLNQDKDAIIKYAKEYDNIYLYENCNCVSAVMDKCDIAVTASGITVYEICKMGLPAIIYTFADNQLSGAKKLEELGVAEYIGDFRELGIDEFIKLMEDRIYELLSYSKRVALSEKMKKLVDAKGCERIYEKILRKTCEK